MIEPDRRRLVVWEARHDNAWATLVMEQPDGTVLAWVGVGDAIGVNYVEDGPELARAAPWGSVPRQQDSW